MANLEELLLEAAGRTGASGRKNRPRARQLQKDSSSEDSASKGGESDKPRLSKRKQKQYVSMRQRDKWLEDEYDEERLSGYDSDSAPSVGSDLYRDEVDKEELGKMSELDRELILEERSTKIVDYQLKKKARETSSKMQMKSSEEYSPPPPVRVRPSLLSDRPAAKKDAVDELLARRMKQQSSEGCYPKLRDIAAASLTVPVLDSSESEKDDEADGREDDSTEENEMLDGLEDVTGSNFEAVKFDDIKAITVRRSKLANWFMEPFFEELIVRCFVRVAIGETRSGHPIYRLCMVKNVDGTDPYCQYKLENRTTYKYLNCIWGSEASAARCKMAIVSDSLPLEEEFKDWVREVERSGGQMPSLKDVTEKNEEIQRINNSVYSAVIANQMLQVKKKSASSRPLNFAFEKDRLRKEIEAARARQDDAGVERIRSRIKELEELSRESKMKDEKAVRLAEMNRKNRAENFKNASEMKPVNTSLKAGEAGYDPFSRRWTRSRNYFVSSKSEGDENVNVTVPDRGDGVAAAPLTGEGNMVGPVNEAEAGVSATTAALRAAAVAGKLVDTKAPVGEGTELNFLHNFELPISLAGLQKYGGPQGCVMGFFARRQRIEATIGYKMLDSNEKPHVSTLTVSDYKRRRGLL